ncbi:MAG: hypothetical protein NVS3B14_00650 [Ktedonobacteraceae bacterium]
MTHHRARGSHKHLVCLAQILKLGFTRYSQWGITPRGIHMKNIAMLPGVEDDRTGST